MRWLLIFSLSASIAHAQYGLAGEIALRSSTLTYQGQAYPATIVAPGLLLTSLKDKAVEFRETKEGTALETILYRPPKPEEKAWYVTIQSEGKKAKPYLIPVRVQSVVPAITVNLPQDVPRRCGAALYSMAAQQGRPVFLGMENCGASGFTILPAPQLMAHMPKNPSKR